MARHKLRKADLIQLAVDNARGPRELETPAAPTCGYSKCEQPIDPTRSRAKHQTYCCDRCRRLAWEERRALRARSEAS